MQQLADQAGVGALIGELARQIGRSLGGPQRQTPWAIVGIRSRGDVLAARLAERLKPDHLGSLDITLYRDDLSEIGPQPVVRTSHVDFAIDGLDVVLVDDVLMTGRSVRAALQSLMDLGRPRRVWLSVLVDRGGRELPVAPDHIAMNLNPEAPIQHGKAVQQIDPHQRVEVHLKPTDQQDQIIVR